MTELTLDHVLIAARDLTAAKDTFASLGFKVTPEGRHPGRGTSNRLVVFAGEYLELIAVNDPDADLFRPNLPTFLDGREGLFIFAMGTPDMGSAVRRARGAGVRVAEPVQGARQAADGSTAYSWTQAELGAANMPGSQTFFIQHDHAIEDRYHEPPDPTNHPNGAGGVRSLTLAVEDATTASRRWVDAFGLDAPAESTSDGAVARLRFANSALIFRQPSGDDGVARFLNDWGEGAYSITFGCRALDATGAFLRQRIAGVNRSGGRLTFPSAAAQGVRMSFTQD